MMLIALWFVTFTGSFALNSNGTVRTYFVGAVEEDWDYMPTSVSRPSWSRVMSLTDVE